MRVIMTICHIVAIPLVFLASRLKARMDATARMAPGGDLQLTGDISASMGYPDGGALADAIAFAQTTAEERAATEE